MIIINQTVLVNNAAGTDVFFYSENLTTQFVVPEAEWLNSGSIFLRSRVRMDCAYAGDGAAGQKFINPTSQQIGYIHLLREGYMQTRHRITTIKEEIAIEHPELQIRNTRNGNAHRFGLEQSGAHSHGLNIAGSTVCLSGEVSNTGGPLPSIFLGQGNIPAGSICTNIFPGESTYSEIDIFQPGTIHRLELDRTELGWFDSISGVVYPGWAVEIGIDLIYDLIDNIAPVPPAQRLIVGSPIPVVYAYTCAAGVPIGAPTNPFCDPSGILVSNQNVLLCPPT